MTCINEYIFIKKNVLMHTSTYLFLLDKNYFTNNPNLNNIYTFTLLNIQHAMTYMYFYLIFC